MLAVSAGRANQIQVLGPVPVADCTYRLLGPAHEGWPTITVTEVRDSVIEYAFDDTGERATMAREDWGTEYPVEGPIQRPGTPRYMSPEQAPAQVLEEAVPC